MDLCASEEDYGGQGTSIGQRLKDKAPEAISGLGQYNEKLYIVEGPQYFYKFVVSSIIPCYNLFKQSLDNI